jgi:hypothetical protein
MNQRGILEECVTRNQVIVRLSETTAMASSTVPHRKPLKGSRKLFHFVEIPGFLM